MVVKLTADFRIEFISGIAEINENDTFLPSITVMPEVPLTNTEELYVSFENGVGSTYANHLFYDADINGYTASIPDGILALGAGTWEFQILRRRYETQNRGRYVEKASVVATFTVAEGVKTVSGTAVTGADLQTIYTVSVQAKNDAEQAATQAHTYAEDADTSRITAGDYALQAERYAQDAYGHSVNASDAKYAAQRAENAAYSHSVDAKDAADLARKFVEQIGDAGALTFKPVSELPTENISTNIIYLVPIADGTDENRFAEYAYIDGKWETLGAVTLNVDHSEYVKFTDYASQNTAGVVKVDTARGIGLDTSGRLYTVQAKTEEILAKTSRYASIVPFNQDLAWKVSATTNTETWTDEDKASACETIGALPNKKPAIENKGDGFVLTINTDGKTISYKRLYGSYVDGPYSVPCRDGNGVIHAKTPTTDTGLTPKKYVEDNFVAQSQPTSGIRLYGSNNVKQTTFDLAKNGIVMLSSNNLTIKEMASGEAKAWTIAERSTDGALYVGTPTETAHATTKAYVDGLVAELLARIEALENK